MSLEDLTEEQKAKARECKTPEEFAEQLVGLVEALVALQLRFLLEAQEAAGET